MGPAGRRDFLRQPRWRDDGGSRADYANDQDRPRKKIVRLAETRWNFSHALRRRPGWKIFDDQAPRCHWARSTRSFRNCELDSRPGNTGASPVIALALEAFGIALGVQ